MKLQRLFTMSSGPHDTGIYVRGVGHFVITKPEPAKMANFGEIFWCIGGSGIFIDPQGAEKRLRPGWLWYYPPNSKQRFFPAKTPFNYRWLSLEGRDVGTIFSALNLTPGLNFCGRCPDEEFARVELNLHEFTRQAQMRALAAALSILIRAAAPEQEPSPRMERVRQLIEENYADPGLNVSRMAELLNMHRVSLSRTFAAAYRIAPVEYLNAVRLRSGMRLLSTTELSIKEVASRCGFAAPGYFAKVLYKLVGQTPQEFRRMNRVSRMNLEKLTDDLLNSGDKFSSAD